MWQACQNSPQVVQRLGRETDPPIEPTGRHDEAEDHGNTARLRNKKGKPVHEETIILKIGKFKQKGKAR